MKALKKITLFVLCLCLFASCMMGCNKKKGDKELLTVLHYRTEDAEFYDWVEETFEEEYNCDVQLDLVPTEGWGQLVEGKLRSDSVDVFGVYPGSVYRDEATFPYMMDLSDMEFVSKLTDEYVDYATYIDGKQYCAPLNLVNNTVFYNKSIFKQYNLSVPTNYSEFIAVCDALQAKSADAGHAGNKVNGVELKAPIIFAARETWPITMTFNSVEATVVRATDPWFWVDVVKNNTKTVGDKLMQETFEKYKKITSYYQVNPFGLGYNRAPGKFAGGEYAMFIDGSWSYSQILQAEPEFEIGVFPLPANDSSEHKNVIVSKPGSGFAIHKNTKHADLAKKFIEFQYRTDVYERFLSEVKMGSVLKAVKNPTNDAVINALYNNDDFVNIAPLSEYIISCVSYPHSICEQLAIGGKDVNYAITTFTDDYNRSRNSIPKLLDKWMAIYNKGYVPNN